MRNAKIIPALVLVFIMVLAGSLNSLAVTPWPPNSTATETTTMPAGLSAVTPRENTCAENTDVISGAVIISAYTGTAEEVDIDLTKMPAPVSRSKDAVRVDNRENLEFYGIDNDSIPYSENKVIPLVASGGYYENNGVVTLRGVSGWVIRVDNFGTADNNDVYIRSPTGVWFPNDHADPPVATGFATGTVFSDDADCFFENVMFRHAVDNVKVPTNLYLRVDTWLIAVAENAFQIDLDNDSSIGENDNLHVVIADNDSDGLMDRIYLSAGPGLSFDNGQAINSLVSGTGDDDENRVLADNTWSSAIRIGNKYQFKVKIRENSPVPGNSDDVSIVIDKYYSGKLSVDVDADGTVDNLNFCFVDENSDGVFDNIVVSAINDNFLHGNSLDENILENNNENVTSAKSVKIGNYLYRVGGVNAPGQSDDFSISSLSRWVGNLYLDIDGDGAPDNIVYFCISDSDSNGIFDTVDVSIDNDTFGEGSVTGNAYIGNDGRVVGQDNMRIGVDSSESCRYSLEFDNTPDGAGYDFRVTASGWYTGTLTVQFGNTFNFVIWDENSDGVFDNLSIDTNGNNNYASETKYSSYPITALLLPEYPYGYNVTWFNRSPAYSDAIFGDTDIVLQHLDANAPTFSNHSPASGSKVKDDAQVVSVNIGDYGDYPFGVDPSTIVMKVNGSIVSHSYSNGVISRSLTGLDDGTVTVQVSACDYAQNRQSTSWSFTVDTEAPSVVIPADLYLASTVGLITSSDSIEIEFTIADSTDLVVTVNGRRIYPSGGKYVIDSHLDFGFNEFEIVARDAAGNSVTKTLSFIKVANLPPSEDTTNQEDILTILLTLVVIIISIVMIFSVKKRKVVRGWVTEKLSWES